MSYPNESPPESLPETLTVRQKSIETLDYVLCLFYIILGFTTSLIIIFGPNRLHDSQGVEFVSGLGVPWLVIGIIFAIHAALLCNRVTRVGGWALGFVLYGYYLESIAKSILIDTNAGSIVAVGTALIAVVSQLSGLFRSLSAYEWRKNR